MVKYPTWSKPVSLNTILRSSSFTLMHPKMQERIRGLMEASDGKVGFGQGMRTHQQQVQAFMSRHDEDPNGPISWKGQRWRRVSGSPLAVPGRSMHGIGLAADLVVHPANDYRWMHEHLSEYGLLHFNNVNGEPWHVQPVEIEKGFTRYETSGLPWGAHPDFKNVSGRSSQPSTGSSGSGSERTPPLLTPALVARPGDSGPAARVLLEAMIANELLTDDDSNRARTYGEADGAIIRKFQADRQLEVDGIVGPKTWGALLSSVKPGDKGPMVKVMQTTLIVRRLIRDNASNLDGDYGTITQERVRVFQEASGIDPIATVGPQTWTALIGVKRRVQVATRGLEPDEDADIDLDDFDFLDFIEESPVP